MSRQIIVPLSVPKPPDGAALLTTAATARGTEYSYLYQILRNDTDDEMLGVAYSAMKFGHGPTVKAFGVKLASSIKQSLAMERLERMCVVHPGCSLTPNAAYFLSKTIVQDLAQTLHDVDIHHVSLESPLAARPHLKEALGTGSHSSRWLGTVYRDEPIPVNELLRSSIVLFVDDGVLTGSVIDKYLAYLKSVNLNPDNVFAIALAKLSGGVDSEFETDVDTKILRASSSPAEVLLWLLNSRDTYLTTRLVYHFLNANPRYSTSLAPHLSQSILLTLYLFAVSYFGRNPPDGLDDLIAALRKYGASLPTAKELREVKYDFFFESLEHLLPTPEKRFAIADAPVVAKRVWAWWKADQQSAPVSLILFDLDHTLVFSQSYYNAVRETGPSVLAQLTGLSHAMINERLERLELSLTGKGLPLRQHDIAAEFGLKWSDLDRATVAAVAAENHIKPDAEVRALLLGLRSLGIRTAVLTDSARHKAENVLSALGILEDCFDAIFTADDSRVLKPAPEYFRRALDHFGATPMETVVVGDSRALDLLPAEALGMRTVLVRTRASLLSLHDAVFSKTETTRRLTNFITDLHGFRLTYFGTQNRSRPADWDLVLRAFQRVFKTFWNSARLDEQDLLEIYQHLSIEFGGTGHDTQSDTSLPHRVNRIVRFTNQILELSRKYCKSGCNIYLGLDGLFWQAADRHGGLHYCLDGFGLSTAEELKAIRPFCNNLLPEHHSIVYRVMQKLMQRAAVNTESHGNLEPGVTALFSQELASAPLQRELAEELRQYRNGIKDSDIAGGYGPSERRLYFDLLIHLLEERNVFAFKAQEIGKDFAQFLSDSGATDRDIQIVDRAIRGTQPLFLKCALKTVVPTWKHRVTLRLLVDPKTDRYEGLQYTMLVREKLPPELEQLRPIGKSRVDRQRPLQPVYRLENSHLADGSFALILLHAGEVQREVVDVGSRIVPQPSNELIDRLSHVIHEALELEVRRICDVRHPDKTIDAKVEVQQSGSTSRHTWVPLREPKGLPLADFDFEILIPLAKQPLVEDVLAHFDQQPGSFATRVREHGHRLTRTGFQWYSRSTEGKVTFLLNASGFEFGIDVLVKTRSGPTYAELVSIQLEQIKTRYGEEGIALLEGEIRRLKSICLNGGIYRDQVRMIGINGVGIEQLVIQSGRVGTDPLSIERIGTVDTALEWVRNASGYPGELRPWRKARLDLLVFRLGSSDHRVGSYLDRLTDAQWGSLVEIAIEQFRS